MAEPLLVSLRKEYGVSEPGRTVVERKGRTRVQRKISKRTGEVISEKVITDAGKGTTIVEEKIVEPSRQEVIEQPYIPRVAQPYTTEGRSAILGLTPQVTQRPVPYRDVYDVNYRGQRSKLVVNQVTEKPSESITKKNKFLEGISTAEKKVSEFLFEPSEYKRYSSGEPIKVFNPKPFREGQPLYFKLPGEVSKEQLRKSNLKVTYTNPFASGIRKEVTEKPLSTGLTVVSIAGGSAAYSYGKLGYTKLAGKFPTLQKTYKAIEGTEKVFGTGLSGAYVGVTGLNIATSSNKSEAIGREFVRFTAVSGGINLGSRLGFKANYLTNFEKNIQKIPQPKQTSIREEFSSLKSKLPSISKGSIKPTEVPFSEVESLQKFPKSQDVVKSFLTNYKSDIVIGGSLSSRTQIKPSKRFNLRPAGDIDVYTDRPGLAKELSAELKLANIPSYYSGNKVFIKGVGKAVEFQGLSESGRGILKAKQSLESNFRTISNPFKGVGSAYKFTPEGLAVTKINIQASRKLYGGFEFSQDKLGRVSSYRYSKDIPDYNALLKATYKPSKVSVTKSMFASTKGQMFLTTTPGVGKIVIKTPKSFSRLSSYYSTPKSEYYSPIKPSTYSKFKFNTSYNVLPKPSSYPQVTVKPYPTIGKTFNYTPSKFKSTPYLSTKKTTYKSVFTKYPTPIPPTYTSYPTNKKPPIITTKVPKPFIKIKTTEKIKPFVFKSPKRSFNYTPTVEATIFKVKGKRPSKIGIESGLILRPLR